jgi:hypothetical protein
VYGGPPYTVTFFALAFPGAAAAENSAHTAEHVNSRISREIASNIRYFSAHKDEIPKRLEALDREWDIERAIEANAAVLALVGTALGATRDRKWLTLPLLVTAFLLQHAIQGWCPPVPVLRRLGFRTSYEIEEERQDLKALRGDFESVFKASNGARAAVSAARI